MEFRSVKLVLKPLIISAQEWQYININGVKKKPKFYFSNIQWVLIIGSCLMLLKLKKGISDNIIGYIIAAFSISVSLFMSLLVSIFDKFENTKFETAGKTEEEIDRLKQKKNFFKRFISITSYLVVLSILIIFLCTLTFIFNIAEREISTNSFTINLEKIDIILTLKYSLVILYRVILNYFFT